MNKLYSSKPSLGNEELKLIQNVFESNWLGLGAFVQEFETKISEYIGAKNVISVNSGTSALHLALEAIGITKGDEVIVPSLTFCASVQIITALKANPVFCEVSPHDLNLDIEDVKSKITSKTKAIIPVHYCGISCCMNELLAIKRQYGIRIVEDAAQAFGSSYKGKKIGSFGDICCFSFDPIKNITCGEGGAIIVHDDKLADLIRKKRILGMDKDGFFRFNINHNVDYDVSVQGFRYHMSNINAAIGLAQLKKIENFQQKKRDIVGYYNNRFSKIEQISLLEWNLSETFPFAYVLKVKDNLRDNLMEFLYNHSIQAGINYIPNHLQTYFKNGCRLPITEKIYSEILTLPLYYDLKYEEVEYVINNVERFFYRYHQKIGKI